jgi:hypothetical protein
MLGHFLGHYPDNFALSDSQRTLILQTMVFFIWLGGGAAVFMKIEEDSGQDWEYADSLYFCDVTVLTVGFGDFYPTTKLGRGIVFPFSVGGIITLALNIQVHARAGRGEYRDEAYRSHAAEDCGSQCHHLFRPPPPRIH